MAADGRCVATPARWRHRHRGDPLPMVHAEKLVTAVQRGVADTRWRDFADVYVLARRYDVSGNDLLTAVRRVAQHRDVGLVPLEEVLDGHADLGT
jgi:hypothetical protein